MNTLRMLDIRYWLLMLIVLLVSVMIIGWTTIEYKRQTRELRETRIQFWRSNMLHLQQQFNHQLPVGALSQAEELLSDYSVDPDLLALAVIDPQQRVVLANRYAWKGQLASTVIPGYDVNLKPQSANPLLGETLMSVDNNHIIGYYNLILKQDTDITYDKFGTLYLSYDTSNHDRLIRYALWQDAQLILLFGLTGIIIFIGFLHYYFSRPLHLLTEASKHIAAGEFHHVPIEGKGELAQLGHAFNLMTQQLKRTMSQLTQKEELFRLSTSAGGVGTWEWDMETDHVTWSENVEKIFGAPPGSFGNTAQAYRERIHPDDQPLFDAAVERALQHNATQRMEHRVIWPDGSLHWIETQGHVERNQNGSPDFMRGTVMDITQRKQAQEEIERLAYYDPLTGLANRRLLLDRIQQASAMAQRNDQCGALIFIDLDRFKVLNDSLGHKSGDILLQQVSKRLLASMRREDTVARLGGDEFVILLPANEADVVSTAHQASRVVEKIRSVMQAHFDLDGHTFHVTCSTGIAIYPQDGEQASTLLNHADAAMYQAKGYGRNTIAFYHASLQARADARLALEEALHRAIDEEEMVLYYQAQVDPQQNTVGAEALIRWQRADKSLVPPNDFIPVAEDSGLILRIGEWVLLNACQQLSDWTQDENIVPPRLSVNVSPLQFRHSGFVAQVDRVIQRCNIDPRLLTLEITEGTVIDDLNDTVAKLQALKDLGVRISIDDFGTGYSSLYYLKHLPLDELKIDKSFVQDITQDPDNAAIVEIILSMARHLNLNVVAEGVETQAQATFLLRNGCECYQGFLYSCPVPADEFARLNLVHHSSHPRQSGTDS